MFVNYSDLPGFPNIFLDYIYEFDKVSEYYSDNPRDENNYENKFKRITNSPREFKNFLSQIIINQYRDLKPSKITIANINNMKLSNTITVTTGQQLGIASGPLYTIYKTLTVLKLTTQLGEKYPDFNFVPVFWLAGDDHDFDEVASINVFNNDNKFTKINYSDGFDEDSVRGSVGDIKFTEEINDFISSLKSELKVTEFSEELIKLLSENYTPGNNFRNAFKQILFSLFDSYGLIIFDPQDKEVKKILKPIFRDEIENYNEHSLELINVSAELEETYHAQVKVNPVNLFFHEKDGRFSIVPSDDGFKLKRKRRSFTKQELLDLIEESPQSFSPNVLLRPICQDYLLPNAFYVGGPSEIAYYAQLMPLYKFFNVEPSIAYPRASATIFENICSRAIKKYNLQPLDFFNTQRTLNDKVITKLSLSGETDLISKAQDQINIVFNNLCEELKEIDKTLIDVAEKSRAKSLQSITFLGNKVHKSQENSFSAAINQVSKCRNLIFPNEGLQERTINFMYFANKYGYDILPWIYKELSINQFEHQIIEL